MQHSFALIRKQRNFCLVLWVDSRLHSLLILATQNNPFGASPPQFEAVGDFLRNPDRRDIQPVQDFHDLFGIMVQ